MIRTLCLILFLVLGLPAQESTIVLLRHAERVSKREHSELTSLGRRRAEALAQDLAPFAPSALFATEYLRTQRTLEPLARRLALEIQVRRRGDERALADELLQDYAGRTVVVCGHSDRLAVLLEALGHPTDLAEVRDFDRLWILRRDARGQCRVEERRQAFPAP